jgi:DNA-binding transcriptional LysR family regulator
MNKLDVIQVFVRVAELGSFTDAAANLGLPKASTSAGVKKLEQLLGTRLLHRTTRKVQLTQDGLAFYERSKELLVDMDELESMFRHGEAGLRGTLRVDMSSGVARNIVIPQLPAFRAAHPGIALELSSTDRRVDLVREGFDCVLRVGKLIDSSLVARPLGHFRLINCASPGYLARRPAPHTLADLQHHELIHYVPVLGSRSPGWEYFDGKRAQFTVMPGAITVNNADAYQAACLAGLGLVQVPEAGVRHLLAQGQLVEVMPQFRAEPMPVSLLYSNRRQLASRVKVFMDWMAQVLQPHLA